MVRFAWSALCLSLVVTLAGQAGAQRGAGPTLAFGGDVMFDGPTRRSVERVQDELGRQSAFNAIFSDVAPVFREADLGFVNLETPISRRYRQQPPDRPVVFASPPALLTALVQAGVDVVSIANNHAYDQGAQGLLDTITALERENLTGVGVGLDAETAAAPRYLMVNGARVAICAWSQGTNRGLPYTERERVKIAMLRDGTMVRSIREAQSQAALTIVSLHWARETGFRLGRGELAVAQQAADAGADIIVGHGMHVPDSSQWLDTADGRRVLLISALGNLTGMMRAESTALYRQSLTVRDAPIAVVHTEWASDGKLVPSAMRVVPLWIARPNARTDGWSQPDPPIARPMNLLLEIARLQESDCGMGCERRVLSLQRRVRLQARGLLGQTSNETGPANLSSLASLGFSSPARQTATLISPLPSLTPRRFLAETMAVQNRPSGGAPVASAPSEPPRPNTSIPRPTRQAYRRGAVFPVTFNEGSADFAELDAPAWRQLLTWMRTSPRLRIQVTGYVSRSERPQAGSLAVERARGLERRLVEAGVSGRRIQTRAGRSRGRRPGEAHLVIRFSEP